MTSRLTTRTVLIYEVVAKARALAGAEVVWGHLGELRRAIADLDVYEAELRLAAQATAASEVAGGSDSRDSA